METVNGVVPFGSGTLRVSAKGRGPIMRMLSVLSFAAVLLSASVFAQQLPAGQSSNRSKPGAAPALPEDVPSKEQLIKLFDVMEIEEQMGSMIAAVGSNMEQILPSNMGDVSEKQKTAMADLNTELYSKITTPEFIDRYLAELIPIYQRHFTRSEVNDLISFYASPAGRKFLREQPILMQESIGKILPLMQKRVQEVMVELHYDQRLREIFAQPDQKSAPPQK
jgi:hypothetical protein